MAQPARQSIPIQPDAATPDQWKRSHALPFVVDGVQFWNVRATGNWSCDIRLGNLFAREAMAAVREDRLPALLSFIANDQIGKGKVNGIVVGFWGEIGRAIMRVPAVGAVS